MIKAVVDELIIIIIIIITIIIIIMIMIFCDSKQMFTNVSCASAGVRTRITDFTESRDQRYTT